ncbi:MAG: Spy/CpxP family protein refolding chaperone [Paludibacterium sp.]|uniref:Spy/CpxP family protein refolding chaperone n=1 Tax=Paludibacterium sp. TaxID=1917523 RepID=UPI002601100B|nr:Spy/CpxP family protein refolding chaperone [Paludibacterium sp.]MBV8048106.1 Spy/CpxP family protein refolding chaperone [Paludibacterium sp.]MBV8647022.1 Spy/CpxP family protein refolding chaperone [Paludibacterium sp.]
MNSVKSLIFVAALATGAYANGALAADSSAPMAQSEGMTHHWQMDPVKRAAMIDHHLQKLHDALNLQPAQESAWQHYAATVKTTFNQPHPVFDPNSTLPERVNQHVRMMESHLANMKRLAAATTIFYRTLTPAQQQTLNEKTRFSEAGSH